MTPAVTRTQATSPVPENPNLCPTMSLNLPTERVAEASPIMTGGKS